MNTPERKILYTTSAIRRGLQKTSRELDEPDIDLGRIAERLLIYSEIVTAMRLAELEENRTGGDS